MSVLFESIYNPFAKGFSTLKVRKYNGSVSGPINQPPFWAYSNFYTDKKILITEFCLSISWSIKKNLFFFDEDNHGVTIFSIFNSFVLYKQSK